MDKGVLQVKLLAKYAVAFPRMSHSILTLVNSALMRLIATCSALTGFLATRQRALLVDLDSVEERLLPTPSVRSAGAIAWPLSTSHNASRLNPSIYFALIAFLISVLLA